MPSFPRLIQEKDATQIKIGKQYLVEKYELVLDLLKCTGCGQCSISCPKEAIILESPTNLLDKNDGDLTRSVVSKIDPKKCVYCGTCSYFCPFDAIHLYKNGEKITTDNLTLFKQKAVPILEKSPIKCSHFRTDAMVYWDGEIKVSYKESSDEKELSEFYDHHCPGECRNCEKICPTDAIRIKSKEEMLKSNQHPVEIDDCLCIKCGACAFACPEGILNVKWTDFHISGAYNNIFWDPIKEKLMKQEPVVEK